MSKINRISLKVILDKIDLILRENDIAYFCDDIDVITEFIQNYAGKRNDPEEVKQFLINNEQYIDKERFILLIVKNYTDNIEIIDSKIAQLKQEYARTGDSKVLVELTSLKMQSDAQKENLKIAKRLGNGVETYLTFYYYDEIEERNRIEVADSRELIDGKRVNLSKNAKRFEEVDLFFKGGNPEEEVGLEYVLQSLLLTDLYNIFPNERFGNDIRTMTLENEAIKRGIKTREELKEMKSMESYEEYTKLLDGISFEGMLSDIKNTLKEYSAYIDLDKLLLISSYRFNEVLESGKIKPELTLHVKEILEGILENIKNIKEPVTLKLQRKLDNSYETEDIECSIEDLRRCLSRFSKNGYITTSKIEEYRSKVESGEITLSQINSDDIDIIFSQEDLEMYSILSKENLIYVCEKNGWDDKKILDLYEAGLISLEDIESLNNIINISDQIDFNKLNQYYLELKQNPENKIVLDKYNRYLELYKMILLKGKSEEEIKELSDKTMEEIIDAFGKADYNEAIKHYFKSGIITLDSIADWSNENVITSLYEEGLISLEDMEGLVGKQKLSYACLSRIYTDLIKDPDIEYDKRIQLIKKGFVREEDIFSLYKRNLLFENDLMQLADEGIVKKERAQRIINSRTMAELERNSSIRLTGLKSLTKKSADIYYYGGYSILPEERTKPIGKFIIDPNEREKFIRLLRAYKASTDLTPDSPFYDYEFYVIPDESGTIGLNSVVIAERYYEDKDTETRFATDNATYFFKYKDLMVLSNLRKSEMTKERQNIVFTANHVIANEKREGHWAQSVISCVAKTMLSSDLKEYSKKNQKTIIFQKLREVYILEDLNAILDMATDIDLGEYICEIQEPEKKAPRKRRGRNISTDDDGR